MSHLILVFFLFCAVPSLSHAQAIYLAPYEGDGTDANPFRATGLLLGHTCKSMRSSEQQQTGYGLCKGPMVPVRAGVINLSGKRAITKADRDQMLADSSITTTATTFNGLISELVDSQNVKLASKAGRQRIIIGNDEIWSRPAPLSSYIPDILLAPVKVADWLISTPVAWAAATLTEDWNCADDSTSPFTCDHSWVRSVGSTATLASNSLRNVNSVGSNVFYNDTSLDSTDMRHRVTIASISQGTATNVAGGAVVRHAGAAGSTYIYCVARDAASDEIEYGHVSSGALTTDGTVSATVANGDTIESIAVDGQVSCKHNGVLVLGPLTESTGDGNVLVELCGTKTS
jgi:hypothetical protein